MTKILVTGSNGQLGNEIQRNVAKNPGHHYTYVDVDELDMTDREAVHAFFRAESFDWIVNCAAYTAVDRAEDEAEQAYSVNRDAVEYLVSSAKAQKSKLIHVSTDYVFDGFHHRPYHETDEPNPRSVYGKSKLAGERHALGYDNAAIIRTSWLYSTFGKNFVKTMWRLTQEKEELKVVYDQAGTPTNAMDLADAIISIINLADSGFISFTPGVYHFSNEGVCSWYDFAIEIAAALQAECHILPIESKDFPTKAVRPFYSVFNKEKIKQTYHLTIPYWKDSLKKCIFELQKKSR